MNMVEESRMEKGKWAKNVFFEKCELMEEDN